MSEESSVLGSLEGCLAESVRELDDSELLEHQRHPVMREAVLAEIDSRKRFEASWSGKWFSGSNVRVPRDPPKETMSKESMRRKEFRKLCAQARSGPKAQRDAAKYLLKTCYGKSVC